MLLKHYTRLGLTALLIAWCFDLLFWKKAPGISFFIFVILCLAGGILLTWCEKRSPKLISLILLLPILFFAIMSFIRQEPLTLLVNYSLTLAGMMILTFTWLGGKWWGYNLRDYLQNTIHLIQWIITKPFVFFFTERRKEVGGESMIEQVDHPHQSAAKKDRFTRKVLAVLVGLLLALPVIAVLAALLSSADPIFAQKLQSLLGLLRLENLGETIFRLVYIVVGGYLLSGVYLYALLASPNEKLSNQGKSGLPAILGWLEAITILICIDLLFAFFVGIQFRYFFGGQANINIEGFTYSEYARRGFGELVIVALISSLVLLGLSLLTRREGVKQRWSFSALGIGLVALVLVILVSAFQRLVLYENAYGFTRLRVYTHVFMVWLGLALVALIFLEGLGKLRYFSLALLITALGFGITLNLMNVDGLIVKQNVLRTNQGHELDMGYLVDLSDDAVPGLMNYYKSIQVTPAVQEQLGAVLACRGSIGMATQRPLSWPSFEWSGYQAQRLLKDNQQQLLNYSTWREAGLWWVRVGGENKMCRDYFN